MSTKKTPNPNRKKQILQTCNNINVSLSIASVLSKLWVEYVGNVIIRLLCFFLCLLSEMGRRVVYKGLILKSIQKSIIVLLFMDQIVIT